MPDFTPGPWRWSNTHEVRLLTDGNDGVFMVMDFVRRGMGGAQPRFNDGGYGMLKTAKANMNDFPDARLIAAAPDLYAACVDMLADLDERVGYYGVDSLPPNQNRLRDVLVVAIRKAEGAA